MPKGTSEAWSGSRVGMFFKQIEKWNHSCVLRGSLQHGNKTTLAIWFCANAPHCFPWRRISLKKGAGLVDSSWPRPQPVEATYQTITIKCRGGWRLCCRCCWCARCGGGERSSLSDRRSSGLPCLAASDDAPKDKTIRCEDGCHTLICRIRRCSIWDFFLIFSHTSLLLLFPAVFLRLCLPGWNNQPPLSLYPCVGLLDDTQVNDTAHLLHKTRPPHLAVISSKAYYSETTR